MHFKIYGVQGQNTENSRLQLPVPKVAIAVWLHISCRLQAIATLGMMYIPCDGGLVWGQMRGVLSEVRGSTPPRGVCITYTP